MTIGYRTSLLQCRKNIDRAYREMMESVSLLKDGESITMEISIERNDDRDNKYFYQESWDEVKL